MRRRSRSIGAALLAGTLVAGPAAAAQSEAAPETTRAQRGVAGVVRVEGLPPLRAREGLGQRSAVSLRVWRTGERDRQEIEFIGAVAGAFDLRDFLVRADGGSMEALPALPIVVESTLPPGHGSDLFESTPTPLADRSPYPLLFWGVVLLWCALPIAAIVAWLRRPRRAAPPPEAIEAPPTARERIRLLLDEAAHRQLDTAEQGQLELLVFRHLAAALPDGAGAEPPAQAHAALYRHLRAHPASRGIVHAIESWLHGRGGRVAETEVMRLLEAYRAERPREAGSSGPEPAAPALRAAEERR